MKVAIVHPWFLAFGGAEHTVAVLAEMYPQADIFTIFCDPATLPESLRSRNIIASAINWLPARYRIYRFLLPIYPTLIETFDLRGYDLVISSDSFVVKSVLVDQGATHICYCHSPMRFLYDQYQNYQQQLPRMCRSILWLGSHYLRLCDFIAAQRVTVMVANSANVSERIRSYYHRESEIIHPPVVMPPLMQRVPREDFYLTCGRLTNGKRIDILIEACNRLGRELVIVGSGRDEARLKKLAGPTVSFRGYVSPEEIRDLYARCKAFLFAANEDFGIVPVEAQAAGAPVIGYGRGGLLETVAEGKTGVFFHEQSADSLCRAILQFEARARQFNASEIREHAHQFSVANFRRRMYDLVARYVREFPGEIPTAAYDVEEQRLPASL